MGSRGPIVVPRSCNRENRLRKPSSSRPPLTRGPWRGGDRRRGWPYHYGRAATGIGSSVRSEIRVVGMEFERDFVAVVILRYDFRQLVPPPIVVPGFAPEPPGE